MNVFFQISIAQPENKRLLEVMGHRLSVIICKLASDISLPILLSLWSDRGLLSVCKLIEIP